MSGTVKWELVAPEWGPLDTVWRNPLPFILWPVCGRPVLAYWLDAALHAGAAEIRIRTSDRPHLVRSWILKGDYWSRPIEVGGPAGEGFEVHVMDCLAGMGPQPPVTDGREMLERWYSLHRTALDLREHAELVIDHELSPGVWAGPGATIHPTSRLTAPCWIGPHAQIGPGCVLGPGVYIGRGCVFDEDVEASEAVVCWDTFVGRHTRLHKSAAQGGILLNWERGSRSDIADDFILSDLANRGLVPGWPERILAQVLRLAAFLPARVLNLFSSPSIKDVVVGKGRECALRTWPKGTLILRREAWLGEVAAGHLRLVGLLPRSRAEWDALDPELRLMFERSPAGVFALSDLFGSHDASDPDEWIHAAYQAGAPDQAGRQQVRRNILKIVLQSPAL